MSARYAPLPELAYMPSADRLMQVHEAGRNKQAGTIKGADALTRERAHAFRDSLRRIYNDFQSHYAFALQAGVPKELARLGMPVGRYTRMRANAVLRNWLAFMLLRSEPDVQWETRQYSLVLEKVVGELFPRTWELFDEVRARRRLQASPVRPIMIIGPGDAGKDELAAAIASASRYRYKHSTSWYAGETVMSQQPGVYDSVEACYADRRNKRDDWVVACNTLRASSQDGLALYNKALKENDILTGIRSRAEYDAVLRGNLVDTVIWVERPGCVDHTCELTSADATVVVENTGDKAALIKKGRRLAAVFVR